MDACSTHGQRGKKKKRKSVLQQARKYGNKGCYGRGSDLPEDVFRYLVRVLELSKDKFETTEDKEIFVNNSLSQMEGEEIKYSSNQLGSRVVETLLPLANDDILMKFLEAFSTDLRPMCMDRFASHVLQKLIVTAAERGSLSVKSDDNPEKSLKYDEWVFKISKFVLNNFEEFVWDPYANHVFRTVLECLGGFAPGETVGRSKKWGATLPKHEPCPSEDKAVSSENKKLSLKKNVPDEFKCALKETAQQIAAWPQFQELPYNDNTSGLLQTLLYVSSSVSKTITSELVRKLLDECFTYIENADDFEEKKNDIKNATIPDIFMNETASRVFDAAIAVASPKRFTQIYARCFINNLGKLAQMSIANYQVQRLFQHCSDKTEFEAMFDEISGSLDDIFRCKTTGVILSLAQACKRLATKQGHFLQLMMKTLHCLEPDDRQMSIAPLTIKFVTYEELGENQNNSSVHMHGSLVLQTMLSFSKPIKIVNSLLAMSSEELKILFSDPKGSHIMDVFMSSESIGEKSREKMIRKLQGSLVALVCSKHGSRSFDALWAILNMKQKLQVMEELSAREPILNGNAFGKIISYNYKISLYKHRLEDWKDDQGKTNRKRALFQDIIGDVGKSKK